MAKEYDNRGRWTLFKNDRKQKDTDPDYTGTLTLQDGTECFFDGWIQTSKKTGQKFMSGKYKPKDAQAHSGPDDNGEEDQEQPF